MLKIQYGVFFIFIFGEISKSSWFRDFAANDIYSDGSNVFYNRPTHAMFAMVPYTAQIHSFIVIQRFGLQFLGQTLETKKMWAGWQIYQH